VREGPLFRCSHRDQLRTLAFGHVGDTQRHTWVRTAKVTVYVPAHKISPHRGLYGRHSAVVSDRNTAKTSGNEEAKETWLLVRKFVIFRTHVLAERTP
jgi:hypothetical protein